MSNNLSRLLLLLFLVLIFLVDGTPRRSRVSQASKAFEEKDNKFEYSHSPGTIDEEENEEDSESETTISSTVEASTSTTKIKTTTTTTEKSVSEEKPEELDNVFTFLQEIGETIQDGFDQNDTSSTLIIDTHYKALDWNLTVDEMDECVKWQKYWNITAKMKNGTDLNNTVAENSEEEEETIELVDLKVKEEIDSSKRLKAIGFDPEILDEYELKKVVIYYEEVCGNHGRTFWFRTRDEAKQIGVDESSPICAPFKEKLNPDEGTLQELAYKLNELIQMVEEGMESPLGNGTQSGEFEFETKVKDPEVMPSRKTKTKTTKKPIETTTTQSSTTEIPEENTIEESTVADDNSTENATSEEIDSLLLEESENVETEKETSIEVYDDDIWDYNDMNKRFKNKPVKYQNLHGITNEQLRSVVMVTKRRKREVSSSEDSNQSDIGEDEDGDAWKTLKTITTANGDTTITVVEEINHIHGANGSSAKSWIKIDATDIIRPTLLLYSPEAIHALGLKISPKFFKRYENVGLYLSTICSEFVPKAVAAFDGKDFKSSGNEYNIGLNVTELELDGVNMTELAEKLRNDTEVDEILLRINGSTKNVGGSYVIPVLDKFKYDPSTAPIVFQGSAVDVRFGIYIESMSNFQTSTMDYDMDIYLMMAWRDVRLRHTYGGTILLKEEELLEKIWRPDPFFANAKEAEFHEVTFLNFLMRIFNDGLILYETRVKIKPSCNLILCKYPHDKQTCDLLIKSFAYPIETVRFEWFSRRDYAIDKNPDVKLPELYIDRYETQNCPNNRKSGAFSCLRAVFRLKRDVGFHIAQTYIPTSLALMFSWVGVWLPEEFMEGRIGVAITVLLTLSTESAGAREHLPSVSYLKAIDLWFGFITGFVFFTLLQTLFVIGFDKRSAQLRKWAGKKGVEMNEETREALLQKATKYHKTGRYLDNFCRVFYPLSFILFLFMYYFVFTEGSQEDCMKR